MFSDRRFILGTIIFVLIAVAATGGFIALYNNETSPDPDTTNPPSDIVFGEKIDDWEFSPQESVNDSFGGFGLTGSLAPASAPQATGLSGGTSFGLSAESVGKSANLGFSVGGAKDVANFRENINNAFLPLPTDVTYEGLYYDYLFDTGATEECDKLFCPSYTSAISKDPFSKKDEYFLSVGLNSGIKEADFKRKKLNLVVVLDISGSMGSSFNRYYYDSTPTILEELTDEFQKSKMEVANESAVALLDHLAPEDRFGMVVFDSSAFLAKPLRLVGETDMPSIAGHVLELQPRGGTNMSAGIETATEMFDEFKNADSDEYENRIIFLTDAQPNTGELSETGMLGMTQGNADDGIYTTFIGIGVDFNTELVESITKIRGANYYAVHSPDEFEKRMDDGFDYMVTPLVFDLELTVEAPGFEIQEVYGSPEADEATGEIMKVNTLFPSERTDGEVRGGLVLLHMKRVSDDNTIKLSTSYKDRNGKGDGDTVTIEFEDKPEYFDNTGIRKGIVLARYASLLQNWTVDERERAQPVEPTPLPRPEPFPIEPAVDHYYDIGIPILPPGPYLSQWERQSLPLSVSVGYTQLFSHFREYFEGEMEAIGDDELKQEVEILTTLIDA